ncbi:MAG: hypothetical protein HY898_04745 [Deltaproteobacteria bacterium]|nr:hypothetical protein [Deltaproteobacteria bacterium]
MKRREPRSAANPQEGPVDGRVTLLRSGACDAGRRWAETFRAGLLLEGRAVAGGWPGTMPEARAVVRASFAAEVARRRVGALSSEEIEWLARIVYASARQDWLSRAEREAPEPAR